MRALVVYESMYGNTEEVARAVAEGLGGSADVAVVEVGVATTSVDHLHLLVVGAPTHAFGLSRPRTRAAAAQQAGGRALVSSGVGLREWLAALLPEPGAVAVAAFDTRVARPKLPGSAARGALRRLRHLGHHPVAAAESFWVVGSPGPLVDGELERARAWGVELGRRCTTALPATPA